MNTNWWNVGRKGHIVGKRLDVCAKCGKNFVELWDKKKYECNFFKLKLKQIKG